jgi:hypothetical protein
MTSAQRRSRQFAHLVERSVDVQRSCDGLGSYLAQLRITEHGAFRISNQGDLGSDVGSLQRFHEEPFRFEGVGVANDERGNLVMHPARQQSQRDVDDGVALRLQGGEQSSALGAGVANEDLSASASARNGRITRFMFARLGLH